MAYEEPVYTVVQSSDDYEVRRYEPHIVAETLVAGDFDESGGKAFRTLAGYIFGKNSAPGSAAATSGSAVDDAGSVKMQMTVPVTMHEVAADSRPTRYAYWFVMERKYDRESLPVPDDSRVGIREVPARTVAALRYSGRATERNFDEHLTILRGLLSKDGWMETSTPQAAVYDGPFTLPFMRRNEVWVEVARETPLEPAVE